MFDGDLLQRFSRAGRPNRLASGPDEVEEPDQPTTPDECEEPEDFEHPGELEEPDQAEDATTAAMGRG
jgi:hypothetical protein